MHKPKYHIFVCSSSRINGEQKGFCFQKGAVEIVNNFIEEIQERELDGEVMVTNTGCFGICSKGPIVVVYPEGVWYGSVTPEDVEEIMDSHIEEGKMVSRLAL
ncbi:(2Fe-2S) ferredoxin [Anaerovirgula multivorans]|uniref:(2Fe-2S) ferredoxin n=1 Tax=Anaerovirgula multivorans TaxID=312168 RepID=A0A239C3G5_9FIRM|nr:2Fe-2S ferredoxin [Anaerovirgula multivorans]SNS14171.1 (2Fe-2S) ferredoxin [Anaerovirgula multivorans]